MFNRFPKVMIPSVHTIRIGLMNYKDKTSWIPTSEWPSVKNFQIVEWTCLSTTPIIRKLHFERFPALEFIQVGDGHFHVVTWPPCLRELVVNQHCSIPSHTMPTLRRLEMYETSNGWKEFAYRHAPYLTFLKSNAFLNPFGTFAPPESFPCLRELDIRQLQTTDEWNAMLEHMPALETLTVRCSLDYPTVFPSYWPATLTKVNLKVDIFIKADVRSLLSNWRAAIPSRIQLA